jgi:hypothetical protein
MRRGLPPASKSVLARAVQPAASWSNAAIEATGLPLQLQSTDRTCPLRRAGSLRAENSSSHLRTSGERARIDRVHPPPIQSFEQRGELRSREADDSILQDGPAERSLLQTLSSPSAPLRKPTGLVATPGQPLSARSRRALQRRDYPSDCLGVCTTTDPNDGAGDLHLDHATALYRPRPAFMIRPS